MAYTGLYNADGQILTTVVDGSVRTGLYSVDGNWNIVINDGSVLKGRFHPCGALNAVIVTDPSAPAMAANGSVNVASNTSSGYSPVTNLGRASTDLLAPPAPILDLVAASDSGSSSTDNITSDTTPDIDITFPAGAVAGDTIQMYDNGTTLGLPHTLSSGEALAAAWTDTLGALANGVHALQATHKTGTHTSPRSIALSITVAPDPTPSGFSWWRLSIPRNANPSDTDSGNGIAIATLEFRNAGVDQAIGGTGFASSLFSGHPAALAFDADGSTAWWSDFSSSWPQIIGYHFASPISVVDSIGIRTDTGLDLGPGGFLLQYSSDTTTGLDGTWTTKNTITGLTTASHSLSAVINFATP